MNDNKEIHKRIMVAGTVDAGKTTLIKALFHEGPVSMEKDKTQSMKYETNAIDTPGEFTASPFMKGALFSTAVGVVTKIDGKDADVERAKGIIRNVCVSDPQHIFCVSAKTGEGIAELRAYIDEKFKEDIRYRD